MTRYPIPAEALDDRLGWIGTSGSGKTYNAGGGVERLLASGARVVIVDPLDVWWGLRLKADGDKAAFPLVIFGGAHGDMPLNEQAGGLLGETVATMSESCIVSLGGLHTKSAERRFMLAFLDALYRKTDPAKTGPFHVIFDEADLWAPQNTSEPALQALMEQIVRRGRIKGFVPWLITQRPAVISKDVLSQVDGLVAFKLTASQDRAAIGEWIKGQADVTEGKAILGSLPTMQRGQGVVWVPGRGILETVAFPPKTTFDSSRTPARGEVRRDRALKALDLSKLKDRLASLEEETKANDPRALKAEIATLRRDLAKATSIRTAATPPPPPPVIANAEAIEDARRQGELAGIAIGITRARQAIDALRVDCVAAAKPKAQRGPPEPREAPAPVVAAPGVTGPQQRVLNALAWWHAFGISHPTSEQVAFVAGYSASSSGYTNLKGAMRGAGLVEYPAPGRVALTPGGSELASVPTGPVTRDAFHEAVRAKLTTPQQRVLNPLVEVYPAGLASSDLAEASGYSPSSSGFTNLKGQMRSLGFLDYPAPGQVRAADWLFPRRERMTREDLTTRARKIVAEHLDADPEKVTDKASFIDDLGADSLDNVELLMAFEEEFDTEISDDEAENCLTFGDAVEALAKKLAIEAA